MGILEETDQSSRGRRLSSSKGLATFMSDIDIGLYVLDAFRNGEWNRFTALNNFLAS